MNKVILMGRLTRDPELRQTQSGVPVCSFTLAVDRRFKNQQGEYPTDFIPIVAWRQQAEFAGRWFQQGMRVAVVGSMQVRTWDDSDGNRRYVTEVIADELHFADGKRDGGGGGAYAQQGGYQQGGGYGQQSGGYQQGGGYGQQSGGYTQRSGGGYDAPEPATAASTPNKTDEQEPGREYSYFEAPDDDTSLPFDI
ncbi:MAG: single-stranded DNA-binding protein [Clostridiaceae bacterium]|nr:single-stranded DNA-binding protein [Clostridiaceae bacterium]